MKNLRNLLLLFFVIDLLGNPAFAQKSNCFEIKYLNFFGLEDDLKVDWSDKELDKLIETKFEGKNYWMIPPIIFQLRKFHPNCNNEFDTIRFNKFTKLYFKIREKVDLNWNNKSVAEQLELIREDFYTLLNDEKILPFMRYSMDDGPLYGEIPKISPSFQKGKSVATNFGRITIVESKNKVHLVASNKQNRVIWSRLITGVFPKRYLQNLEFNENPLQETPFATVVYLHTSERLTLYLKPDGKFICYFHSW